MYSVYLHDFREKKDFERKRRSFSEEKTEATIQKRNEELAKAYKERIEKYINENQNPLPLEEDLNEKSTLNKFRGFEDKTKNIGEAFMRLKSFKTEKERIEETLRKNQIYLPYCPSKKFKYREDSKGKEIASNMKFTPGSNLERALDSINQQGLGTLRSYDLKKSFREYKVNKKKQQRLNLSDVVATKSNQACDALELLSQLLPSPQSSKKKEGAEPAKEEPVPNSKFLNFLKKMKPKEFMQEYHNKTFYKASALYAFELPLASAGITQKKIEITNFIKSKTFNNEMITECLGHKEEFRQEDENKIKDLKDLKQKAKIMLYQRKFVRAKKI